MLLLSVFQTAKNAWFEKLDQKNKGFPGKIIPYNFTLPTRFDFVAAEILFGFGLNGQYALG